MNKVQHSRYYINQLILLTLFSAIVLGIFMVDWHGPSTVATGTLYCVAILYSWLFNYKLGTVLTGILATTLILTAFVLNHEGVDETHLNGLNPAVSIVVVWICVALVILAKNGFSSLQEHQRTLEQKIEEKTKEAISNHQKFEDFLESAPDPFLVTLHSGEVVFVNQRAERLFDSARPNLIGKKLDDLFTLEDDEKQRVGDYIIRTIENTPDDPSIELSALNPNGKKFPVEMNLSHIESNQGEFIAVALRDVSEKNRIQKELAQYNTQLQLKNKELEQFAYISSHDLQEPLRTVDSFVKLLQEQYGDNFDETADQYMSFVHESVERMQEFIKGLLEYSRIGRGKAVEKIDLNELVKGVEDDLHASLTANRAQLIYTELPSVQGFKHDLRQLFLNLVSNAIKFKKKDVDPVIEINSEKIQNGYRFSVKDNGIGIDATFKDKIFVIFQRLHTRSEYSGTGIGLAYCKKIVDHHHGEIWFDSEEGQGTTFNFTLFKPEWN